MEESKKLSEILTDVINGIKRNETKITFIGSEDKQLLNESLKKLQKKLGENGFNARYFIIPDKDSAYFSNKKTYLTEILDELMENKEESKIETKNGKDQPEIQTEEVKNLMNGLGAMFKNLMPALNSISDNLNEDIGESTEENPDEDGSVNIDVEENQDKNSMGKLNKYKVDFQKTNNNMKINWEDEEETEENIETEPPDLDSGLNNTQENNEELEFEGEENPEEIEGNVEEMMNMLKDQLGPMIGNLSNMFGNLSEKIKDLEGDLDEIADDIEKSDDDTYYIDDTENEREENIEKNETKDETDEKITEEIPNLSDLSNLFGNLTNQLKNLGMVSEDSEDNDEKFHEDKEENNQNIRDKMENKNDSLTSDPRNDLNSVLTSKENSDFFEELIEKLEVISKSINPLILLIENINNSSELTYNVFEEILMNHKSIPLILIAGYDLESIKKSNTQHFNKNLRLLLTKYKIDGLGLDVRL